MRQRRQAPTAKRRWEGTACWKALRQVQSYLGSASTFGQQGQINRRPLAQQTSPPGARTTASCVPCGRREVSTVGRQWPTCSGSGKETSACKGWVPPCFSPNQAPACLPSSQASHQQASPTSESGAMHASSTCFSRPCSAQADASPASARSAVRVTQAPQHSSSARQPRLSSRVAEVAGFMAALRDAGTGGPVSTSAAQAAVSAPPPAGRVAVALIRAVGSWRAKPLAHAHSPGAAAWR